MVIDGKDYKQRSNILNKVNKSKLDIMILSFLKRLSYRDRKGTSKTLV